MYCILHYTGGSYLPNFPLFQVKAILVNIFAGIVNCATIANGVVNAFKLLDLKVPLVVRLDGEWLNLLIMLDAVNRPSLSR